MPEISTAAGAIFYTAPKAVVSVAAALREASFAEVPYLRCTMLHVVAAPEIDQAILEYEYGTILREDGSAPTAYTKQDLVGKYVKVEIIDTVLDASDDPVASIVWYGKIENDQKDVWGSREDVPTGIQTITAFGLLRIAERTPILTSIVEDPADDAATIEIKHALPFNQDGGGIFVRRGNRSVSEDTDNVYVFSPDQRALNAWDAYEATRYLLKKHAPKDKNGLESNEWRLHADVTANQLDWYDIAVECNSRSLKEVLDDLINRRRGVGYYATFDPDDDGIDIHVFTFAETNVTLPTGKVLGANPDQYTLDFESALDVDATVSTVGTTQWHKVVARGAKRTTTFTAKLLDPQDDGVGQTTPAWVPDWTTAEQNEYQDGASVEPGYSALSADEKQRANTMWRASDRLRNVFTRWKINPYWDQLPRSITDVDSTDWLFVPEIPVDDDVDPDAVYAAGTNDNEPNWLNGMRVLRGLPFLDRYNYEGTKIDDGAFGVGFSDTEQPEFIPPFAFLETLIEGSSPLEYDYELLDKLNLTSATSDNPRRWAASFQIVDTECAFILRAHPAQMLAHKEWTDNNPAVTPDEHDPTKAAGADWRNIRVTVCCEINEHLEVIESIDATPASDLPIAKLIIEVPDARFDWVVPFTVVEIKNGEAIQSTTGGAVRDDRKRLGAIARCAAEWYGRNRQTLDLNYKQVRAMFGLGWLITSVGANYSLTDINTVVTSITYTLNGQNSVPSTTVKTSYADLDVL